MQKDFQLKGVKEVMRNLNNAIQEIEGASMEGLIRAAIIIRRDMEDTPPKIPVDYGNLRAGCFIVTARGAEPQLGSFQGPEAGKRSAEYNQVTSMARSILSMEQQPSVGIGFSANYAVFVHENLQASFKRRGAGPRFFQTALERNYNTILDTVRKHAKI